jgi:hypothetical protein
MHSHMTIGLLLRKEKLHDGHMSEAKYGAIATVNPRIARNEPSARIDDLRFATLRDPQAIRRS